MGETPTGEIRGRERFEFLGRTFSGRGCASLVLGALAVALAGCARFEAKPLSSSATAAAFDARALDNPALKAFLEQNLHHDLPVWPPHPWDFTTLTLAAFYYHPSLAVARAQWGVAQAGIKTARARPNPTVSAVPTYNFNHINAAPGLSPWLPAVAFDLPIETAGKRGYRVAQARSLSNLARWNIVTTAWQVRSNLRASLLDLGTALRRGHLLTQQLALQQQIVQRLEQRLAVGAVARSDVTAARILLERTRIDEAEARRLGAAARVRVADAIGLPVSALDGVNLAFDLEDPPSRAGTLTEPEARRAALQGRTDILAALDEYAASQAALQLEIARQYPDLRLGSGYQWNQGDNVWDVSLSAEVPLFNRNQGPIAEAEARRTESAARFVALQAQVVAQIDSAVAAYRLAGEQLAANDALLANERQQLAAAQAQAAAGAADPLDLLNARLELGMTELARADALARTQQAVGALEDAVQQPLDSKFTPAQVLSTNSGASGLSPSPLTPARVLPAPARRGPGSRGSNKEHYP